MQVPEEQSEPRAILKKFIRILRIARWVLFVGLLLWIIQSDNRLWTFFAAVLILFVAMVITGKLAGWKLRSLCEQFPEFGKFVAQVEAENDAASADIDDDEDDDDDFKSNYLGLEERIDGGLGVGDEQLAEKWEKAVPGELLEPHSDEDIDSEHEEGESIEDTLYVDTTGDGVELAAGLFEGGFGEMLHCLTTDPNTDWNITPWGNETLFAMEAVLACSGQPSQSSELRHLRAWGEGRSYQPPKDMVEVMLSRLDFILDCYKEDPEKFDCNPDMLDEALAAGKRMRERIEKLA